MNPNRFSQRGSKEEQKTQYIDFLLLDLCMFEFDKMDVPALSLNSCKAATAVANEWKTLSRLLDVEIVARYKQAGLSSQFLKFSEMRERLKKIAWWKELPHEDLHQKCRSK